MNRAEPLYYQARVDQPVNDLPVFFGQMEFQGDRVKGKQYRVRIDLGDRFTNTNKIYVIGYYWLDQCAAEFLEKFEANHLVKISAAEFKALLDSWTRGGEYPAICWNPEDSPQVHVVHA